MPDHAGLSATRVADRHVTLAFLGPVPDDDVSRCWASLPRLALPAAAAPTGWARFGRSAIVVTLADDDRQLIAAMDACHDAAAEVFDLRRPAEQRPHVTLARVRRRAKAPRPHVLRGWDVPAGPVEVGRVTLFRSRPSGSGDRYEVVEQQTPA